MSEHKFPSGWDEHRARDVISHYDSLSEDEQAAKDDAAAKERAGRTVIAVPEELLPAIRQLLAERECA